MLPDFPEARRRMLKQINEDFARRKAETLGVFSEIKVSPLHEGDRSFIQRPDGREEETQFKVIEVTSKLSTEDERSMTEDQLTEHLMKMADEMADQQCGLVINSLNEAITQTGNVISTNSVGPQTLLDVLDKIQIPFRPDGKHDPLTIVGGVAIEGSMKKAIEAIEHDPIWRSRYEQLMRKKREEWNARESTRKLVG